jgi:3-phosphoshikimate 1-carboxyvinyltransferase
VILNDPGCVSKTCPGYFEMLSELGVGVEYVK